MTRPCVYQEFVMAFVGHYSYLPCSPMCSRAFNMHPNWPMSDIISPPCAIMCIYYVLESDFIGYLTIHCVLDGPNQTFWTFTHPVSKICPNCCVFIGYLL